MYRDMVNLPTKSGSPRYTKGVLPIAVTAHSHEMGRFHFYCVPREVNCDLSISRAFNATSRRGTYRVYRAPNCEELRMAGRQLGLGGGVQLGPMERGTTPPLMNTLAAQMAVQRLISLLETVQGNRDSISFNRLVGSAQTLITTVIR